jgi:hypothetical protein
MVGLMRAAAMRRRGSSTQSRSFGQSRSGSDDGLGLLFLLVVIIYFVSVILYPGGSVNNNKVEKILPERFGPLEYRFSWKNCNKNCMKLLTREHSGARLNDKAQNKFLEEHSINPEEAIHNLKCGRNYYGLPKFFDRVRLDFLTNRAIYTNIEYLFPKMAIMLSGNIFNPRSPNKDDPDWYTCPLPHYAKLLRVPHNRILDYFDLEHFFQCFDMDILQKLLQSNDYRVIF